MSGFNLRNIQTVETYQLAIKDPDGNPTGVVFTLASPSHPVRKALEMAVQRKIVMSAGRMGKVVLPDPEETSANRPKDLARLTLGWSGFADENGPVPFSQEAAEALYADPGMLWLADQVDAGLGNRQLYTRSASPT